MGGGDLNLKKSWHPNTKKNQEKIWKREQEREQEKKKLVQLRKELQEERDREELELLKGRKNKKPTNDRLEWMYSAGPATDRDSIAQEKEDYLLGRKTIESTDEVIKITPSLYGLHANTDKDFASKVREDPLLMFKKQEQLALDAMMKNPIRRSFIDSITKNKKSRKSSDVGSSIHRSRSRSPGRYGREPSRGRSEYRNTYDSISAGYSERGYSKRR